MIQEILDRYTLAYKLYLNYCKKYNYGIVRIESFSKEKYFKFFKEADIIMRNKKINKILKR